MRELQQADLRLRRRINSLKLMTEDRDFTYEPPEMIYDKKTGDVTILPKKIKKKNTIIRSHDDLAREREALMKEVGFDADQDIKADLQGNADKLYEVEKRIDDDFDFDPS